ncbi:MAG: choice-of-anchor V domain-containing protein [Ignavibacteria bacterium]
MTKKILLSAVLIVFVAALYTNIKALSGGIVNLTKRAGNTEGCTCHGFDTTSTVRITFQGPAIVQYGDTVTYTVRMTGGPLLKGGIDISAGRGQVLLSSLDNSLQRLEASVGIYELTHVSPKLPVTDTIKWTFRYVAPLTGTWDTLFTTGNSVNGTGGTSGDSWNFGQSKVITVANIQGISENTGNVNGFKLNQNFPNPFNPSTKINFLLNKSGLAKLSVFDSKGNLVKNLLNERKNAGEYTVDFNGSGLSSGVYFYKLEVNGISETKRMLLIK